MGSSNVVSSFDVDVCGGIFGGDSETWVVFTVDFCLTELRGKVYILHLLLRTHLISLLPR